MDALLTWLSDNRWKAYAMTIMVLAIVLISKQFFPRIQNTVNSYSELSSQRERVAAAADWEMNRKRLEAEKRQLRERFELIYVSLPSSDNMSTFVGELNELAEKHSVSILQLKPKPVTEHSKYREVPMEVDVVGSFDSIGQLVSSIEASRYLIKVESVRSQISDESTGEIESNLDLRLIVLRGEG